MDTVLNSQYDEIKIEDECAADYLYETAEIFLHGSCQLFSLALHKKFGYKAFKISKGEKDVHYFCMKEHLGLNYYVDVRGMTNNFKEFASEFAFMKNINDCKIEPQDIREDSKLQIEGDVTGYAFANEIIEKYSRFYSL